LLYGWDDKKLEKNWNRWKNNRKEGEKEYMKKLKESLEWNKRDEQISKKTWGMKKKFLWKQNSKRGVLL